MTICECLSSTLMGQGDVSIQFSSDLKEGTTALEGSFLKVFLKQNPSDQEIFHSCKSAGVEIRKAGVENVYLPLLAGHEDIQIRAFFMGNYAFDRYRSKKESFLKKLYLDGPEPQVKFKKALDLAALNRQMRDLDSAPYNECTVEFFANYAKALVEGLPFTTCHIMDHHEMARERFWLHLAVGKGSLDRDPPKVVVLHYCPQPGAPSRLFVGKGVVFDTGGYAIKPEASMKEMNGDMAGASLFLHLFAHLAQQGYPKNILVILPLADNSIDQNAFRLSDIYVGRSGKSVEITSTDAEGRLLLVDSLDFGLKEFLVSSAFTAATLTGAAIVALGKRYAAFFTNDLELRKNFFESSKETLEPIWELPLNPQYMEDLKSSVADMKNCGNRQGGACQAASFLQAHIDPKVPFAHLDIAAVSMSDSVATGYGLALFADFAYRCLR